MAGRLVDVAARAGAVELDAAGGLQHQGGEVPPGVGEWMVWWVVRGREVGGWRAAVCLGGRISEGEEFAVVVWWEEGAKRRNRPASIQ